MQTEYLKFYETLEMKDEVQILKIPTESKPNAPLQLHLIKRNVCNKSNVLKCFL